MLTPLCTPEIAINHSPHGGTVAAIRCKRWTCECCAEINRRKVIKTAADAKPKAMLTLTVSSKDFPCPTEAAAELKRALRLLRLSLKRHARLENFEFMAVFEKHKSGHPHLHLLTRGKFLPWKWLRNRWKDITGSTHVDIRKIKGHRDAARYVSKYLGKDLTAFEGCKRWWRSSNYSEEANANENTGEQKANWQRFTADLIALAHSMELEGYQVGSIRHAAFEYKPPPALHRSPIELIWTIELEKRGHDWDHIDAIPEYRL